MQKETVQEPKTIDLTQVWGVPLSAVHCPRCGDAHLVPQDALKQAKEKGATLPCPSCLQGPVAPQPAYLREEPPEQVLPYGVSEQRLSSILEQWSKGGWFRPSDLSARTLLRRARRYFLPLWLVDGRVEATWKADVGFDYQVKSYQDRYREGAGWSSQERKETKIRWEPRVGRLNRGYENLAAPALEDHRAWMARLGNVALDQRVSYSTELLANAVVRIPSLDPDAAWPGVEVAFTRAAGAECQQAAGADHIRSFTLQADYGALNWTQLLLPAYVTWYREGDRIWPVWINGQTGRVSGVRRASARKARTASLVLGGIALLLFLIGGIIALLGAVFPPAVVLGGILLIIGLLLAVTAPLPAIGVWMKNRKTE